jgi:hypothetical protein
MPRPVLTALTFAVGVLMATGCTRAVSSPTSTATTAPPAPLQTTSPAPEGGLQVGLGPEADDTVQAQPAPGSCTYTFVGTDPLPDRHCTPGAVDPQVTQANVAATICSSGFTSSIRPPERITEPEKEASAAAYGYTGSLHLAEYDHLVPLELGGDPNDPANLWVEPPDDPDATSFANAKDGLEAILNRLVCSGQLPLTTAQRAMASDWVAAARIYGGWPVTPSRSDRAPVGRRRAAPDPSDV